MIRGLEIDPAVADGPQSCVLEQVTNGLAVRMALLFLLMARATEPEANPMRAKGPHMLRIKNGRVIDPASGTDALLDVWLEGDRIARVAPPGTAAMASGRGRRDARRQRALIVAPGFIDLHCHLREPGVESSETIETGTRAAARGGFTAVCPMPNTRPVNDSASVTRGILERAAAAASTRVWPIGAASAGSQGEALAEIAAMQQAGIVAVSDDGKPIATAKLLRQVMDYCRALDLPVIDHCEDASLFAGAVDARRTAVGAAGPARHARGHRIHRRGARHPNRGADRLPLAHRASFGDALRWNWCARPSSAGCASAAK